MSVSPAGLHCEVQDPGQPGLHRGPVSKKKEKGKKKKTIERKERKEKSNNNNLLQLLYT